MPDNKLSLTAGLVVGKIVRFGESLFHGEKPLKDYVALLTHFLVVSQFEIYSLIFPSVLPLHSSQSPTAAFW